MLTEEDENPFTIDENNSALATSELLWADSDLDVDNDEVDIATA